MTATNRGSLVRATAFMVAKDSTDHTIRMSMVNSKLVGQREHWVNRLVELGLKVLLILQLMIPEIMSIVDDRNHFVGSSLA